MTRKYRSKTLLSLFIGLFVCSALPLAAEQQVELQPTKISEEDMQKLSETFGHFIGRNLKAPGINLDVDKVVSGLRKGYEGKPAPLTDQEFETMMSIVQAQAFTEMSEKNLEEANAFLQKNKKEKEITSVESDKLQFKVLEKGDGETVEKGDTPLIKYKGSYLNGTVFGSSEESGGPVAVPLDQTIPGFSKGLLGMKEGEKRKLFVHPDLGYGTSGALQPNALLVFEVEVLEADHEEEKNDSNAEE